MKKGIIIRVGIILVIAIIITAIVIIDKKEREIPAKLDVYVNNVNKGSALLYKDQWKYTNRFSNNNSSDELVSLTVDIIFPNYYSACNKLLYEKAIEINKGEKIIISLADMPKIILDKKYIKYLVYREENIIDVQADIMLEENEIKIDTNKLNQEGFYYISIKIHNKYGPVYYVLKIKVI